MVSVVQESRQPINQRPPLDHMHLDVSNAFASTLSIVLSQVVIFAFNKEALLKVAIFVTKIAASCLLQERHIESLALFVNELLWQYYHVADVFVKKE